MKPEVTFDNVAASIAFLILGGCGGYTAARGLVGIAVALAICAVLLISVIDVHVDERKD